VEPECSRAINVLSRRGATCGRTLGVAAAEVLAAGAGAGEVRVFVLVLAVDEDDGVLVLLHPTTTIVMAVSPTAARTVVLEANTSISRVDVDLFRSRSSRFGQPQARSLVRRIVQ
jgi:hypothetical protein